MLPDLSTFYGRKVGIFTAVKRPIYGNLFTGSRYKKRRKFWCITIKIRKLNKFEQYQKTFEKSKNSINVAKSL